MTLLLSVLGIALAINAVCADHGFKIDFDEIPPTFENGQGTVRVASGWSHPGLSSSGFLLVQLILKARAINLPHIHPHAGEVLIVQKGSLRTCIVTEYSDSPACSDLEAGQGTTFPAGSIHYEQNFGDGKAEYLIILNNENPGMILLPAALLKLPSEALSAAFNRPINAINEFRERSTTETPARSGPGARPAKTWVEAFKLSGFPTDQTNHSSNGTMPHVAY
eukprot:Plantae.Rhodophyta-Rhodochaete_pulchella.ctg4623.p1 GENE.Plantae.Rhodophyta-Rhodochaete_pulchella.ctg4623~~Plantae.Rhodophyta-Rhodochaete_pulchella.ctg4623.p1  ORF type:complete len:222 (-),score=34.58 Plantae.Rhodophyta-Rhodochaete_pulchella.ctg4623:52-717(-)